MSSVYLPDSLLGKSFWWDLLDEQILNKAGGEWHVTNPRCWDAGQQEHNQQEGGKGCGFLWRSNGLG